jgi:hypothetical protein
MKIEKIKETNIALGMKSFQMRIEFADKFCESSYEHEFVKECDDSWERMGIYYMWHIGENLAEGFFSDFNKKIIDFDEIILVTLGALKNYEAHISKVVFKEIN